MNKHVKSLLVIMIVAAILISISLIILYKNRSQEETPKSILEALLKTTYPQITPAYIKYIRIDIMYLNKTINESFEKFTYYKKALGNDDIIKDNLNKSYKYLTEAKKLVHENPYQALIFLRKAQYYLSVIEGYFLAKNNELYTSSLRDMIKDAWDKYLSEWRRLHGLIYCGKNLSTVIIRSYIVERHMSSAKTWLEQAAYYIRTSYWIMDKAIIYAFIKVSLNNIVDAEMIYRESYRVTANNYTDTIIGEYIKFADIVDKAIKEQVFDKKTYAYTIYLESRGYFDQGKQYYEEKYYTHALFNTLYSYILIKTAYNFTTYPNPSYGEKTINLENIVETKRKICTLINELLENSKNMIDYLLADKILLDSKRADLFIKYMYSRNKVDQHLLFTCYLLYLKTLKALELIVYSEESP